MFTNFMILKAKEIGVHLEMSNEEQVNEIFQKKTGNVFVLKIAHVVKYFHDIHLQWLYPKNIRV